MNEYSGKSERDLRALLEDCTHFQERRKIRAAIKELHSPSGSESSPNPTPTRSHSLRSSHPNSRNHYRASNGLDKKGSNSASQATSSNMASPSLTSRPMATGLGFHGSRRGTMPVLPTFTLGPIVSDPATSPLFTVADRGRSSDRNHLEAGVRHGSGDSSSLSRLGSSRFVSASVFDKSDSSKNGVYADPSSSRLSSKRHSLADVGSEGGSGNTLKLLGQGTSGLRSSTTTGSHGLGTSFPFSTTPSSTSSLFSPFENGQQSPLFHYNEQKSPSPNETPKRINIRRGSHMFLSDGETHSPAPLLPPARRGSYDYDPDNDNVFAGDDARRGSTSRYSLGSTATSGVLSASSAAAGKLGSSRDTATTGTLTSRPPLSASANTSVSPSHTNSIFSSPSTARKLGARSDHSSSTPSAMSALFPASATTTTTTVTTSNITNGATATSGFGGGSGEQEDVMGLSDSVTAAFSACVDEEKLLDMLCRADDFKERCKIRARMKELKDAREAGKIGDGVQPPATTTTTTSTKETPSSSTLQQLSSLTHPHSTPIHTSTHSASFASSVLSKPTQATAADHTQHQQWAKADLLSQAERVSRTTERDGPLPVGGYRDTSTTSQSGTVSDPRNRGFEGAASGSNTERDSVSGGGDGKATTTKVATKAPTKEYDHIYDIEQLRQLLSGTVESDEKRKIRNAMRLVRRNSELEKAKTDIAPLKPYSETADDKGIIRTRGSSFSTPGERAHTRSSALVRPSSADTSRRQSSTPSLGRRDAAAKDALSAASEREKAESPRNHRSDDRPGSGVHSKKETGSGRNEKSWEESLRGSNKRPVIVKRPQRSLPLPSSGKTSDVVQDSVSKSDAVRAGSPLVVSAKQELVTAVAENEEQKSAFVPISKSGSGSSEQLRSFVVEAVLKSSVQVDSKSSEQTVVTPQSAFESVTGKEDKRSDSPAHSLHSRPRRPPSPSQSIANKVVRPLTPDHADEKRSSTPVKDVGSQDTRSSSPRVPRPQSPSQYLANQERRASSPLHSSDSQDQRPPSPQISAGLHFRRPSSPAQFKRPPSQSQSLAGQIRRPSSPFLSEGKLHSKQPPPSPTQPSAVHIKRPSSPFLTGGVLLSDKRPESPFQPGPFKSLSEDREVVKPTASSPAESQLTTQQEKRPPSPAKSAIDRQVKRPSSPTHYQQDRRPSSPAQAPNNQHDKRPSTRSQLPSRHQESQLAQSPSNQQEKRPTHGVNTKPEKRRETSTTLTTKPLQSPAPSLSSLQEKRRPDSAQSEKIPDKAQIKDLSSKQTQISTEKSSKAERAYDASVLTEFSALKTPPASKTLKAADTPDAKATPADRQGSSDSTSAFALNSSAPATGEHQTSLSGKESVDWDLVNQVKARLKSRSESLTSEEKIPGFTRASKRSSLASTSEVLDSGVKSVSVVADTQKTSLEVQPKLTAAEPQRASEPRYKEIRELVRTSGLDKKSVQEEPKPISSAVKPGRLEQLVPEVQKSTHTTEKQVSKPEESTTLLSDFDKLDKGLRPSASRSLVSSLAGKFSAHDTDRASHSSSLRRSESVTLGRRGSGSEKEQKSLLPRRSESFGSHDAPRRPITDKQQTAQPTLTKQTTVKGPSDNTSDVSLIPVRKISLPASASPVKSSATDSVVSRRASTSLLDTGDKSNASQPHDDAFGVKKTTSLFSFSSTMTKEKPAALTSEKSSKGSDMESAFSALLDDMETFSASEGTSSDLDLSDGDEAPPTSGANKGGSSVAEGFQQKGLTDVSLAPVAEVVEEKASDNAGAGVGGDIGDVVDAGREVVMINKEDSGIGMGTGDLDDAGASAPQPRNATTLIGDSNNNKATLPSREHDVKVKLTSTREPPESLSDEDEDDDTSPPQPPLTRPPSLPSPEDEEDLSDMSSSAFLVLKPHIDSVVNSTGQQVDAQGRPLENAVSLVEDEDGTVTFRKISQGEQQNRIVTIKSKKQRTPSNADEEMRDTIVETNFHSPGGALIKERDVISTKRKITQRGSNYFQRTTQYTRRVRDKEGSETIEHDVCVESDNTSASEGHSWGDRTVTKVTLDQASGELPRVLDELGNLPLLEGAKKTQPAVTVGKMDMSKASSGYGSVSGSEEEDKEGGAAGEPKPAKVLGSPEIVGSLKDVSVTEGQVALLECSLIGQPTPEVTWYCGDKFVDVTEEHYTATFDPATGKASLSIHDVVLEDAAVYACVCRNQHGEAATRSSVAVKPCTSETTVVPMFLTKLPNKTITDGDGLLLECDVIGSPEPSIDWLIDGRPLSDTTLSFSTSYDGRVARLQVDEVTLSDEGVYELVAENSAGKVSMDARVSVHVKNKPPTFTSAPSDFTVDLGKNVVLKCDVTGTPSPSVFWRRNGLIVADTPEFVQSLLNGCARLEIMGTKEKHAGQYECVAKNVEGDASCSCKVTVKVSRHSQPPQEQQPPAQQQQETPPPPVVTRRSFKKLSEPHATDVISAVMRSAEMKTTGVQRAQSFSPSSSTVRESAAPAPIRSFSVVHGQARTLDTGDGDQEEDLSDVLRKSEMSQQSSEALYKACDTSSKAVEASSKPFEALLSDSSHSRSPAASSGVLGKISESSSEVLSRSSVASSRISGVSGRSASFNEARKDASNSQSPSVVRARREPSDADSFATPVVSSTGVANGSASAKTVAKYTVQWTNPDGTVTIDDGSLPSTTSDSQSVKKDTLLQNSSSQISTSTQNSTDSLPNRKFSAPVKQSSSPLARTDSDRCASPDRKVSEPARPPSGKKPSDSPRSLVSQLRDKFSKEDDSGEKSGGGIRRWHSMPLKQERPDVVKRERPSQVTSHSGLEVTSSDTMSASYDHINDEEELHKLMNATDSFDDRKKIRSRLREIRDNQRAEVEERRKQREKETEDLVRKKLQMAEEEKKRKLEAFASQKPMCERDTQYHSATQKLIEDKKKLADEEKAKKLEAYKTIAQTEHTTPAGASVKTTTTTSTAKTPDGTTTVTKKTETTIKQVSGFGGVQYSKAGAGPAKPQGARGAMAAFKQMDATNPGAKLNAGGGGGGKAVVRSASTIKQILLDWCKAMTREYENIEVTNFSTCWNNGLAFCALIHHFFPDAFDYSKLDPKQRRYNFTLAFDTAEKLADIAPLLDVEDMVKMKNPDWKCVFTYVQSIYRHLRDHENNKAKSEA